MFSNLKNQTLRTRFEIIYKITRKISYIIKCDNFFITFDET